MSTHWEGTEGPHDIPSWLISELRELDPEPETVRERHTREVMRENRLLRHHNRELRARVQRLEQVRICQVATIEELQDEAERPRYTLRGHLRRVDWALVWRLLAAGAGVLVLAEMVAREMAR